MFTIKDFQIYFCLKKCHDKVWIQSCELFYCWSNCYYLTLNCYFQAVQCSGLCVLDLIYITNVPFGAHCSHGTNHGLLICEPVCYQHTTVIFLLSLHSLSILRRWMLASYNILLPIFLV